ncbi:hypothetical protein GCM10023235_59660 [Kitasatospora terrestris]|uniref:Uncharacterized protein n=1 Tax=Kitasatospora terrestris TaxID=258051 RepID=A0ABP9EA99_9ACTN
MDLRNIPTGILTRQLSMGIPNMRTGTRRARRCATVARPYGPAPTTVTGTADALALEYTVPSRGFRHSVIDPSYSLHPRGPDGMSAARSGPRRRGTAGASTVATVARSAENGSRADRLLQHPDGAIGEGVP